MITKNETVTMELRPVVADAQVTLIEARKIEHEVCKLDEAIAIASTAKKELKGKRDELLAELRDVIRDPGQGRLALRASEDDES